MRAYYRLPEASVSLTGTKGNEVRARELIRAFRALDTEIITESSGESSSVQAAQGVYRGGVKRLLPPKISGTMRDFFHYMNDRRDFNVAYSRVEKAAPIDFIYEDYTYFYESGVRIAEKMNVPIFMDDIAPIWEREVYFRLDLKRLAYHVQRNVFEKSFGLVAVSNTIAEYLHDEWNVPHEKILRVMNGVDIERFVPNIGGEAIREKYNLKDKAVVGFVGSFAPWRGIPLLVESIEGIVAEFKDIHFLLIGDGGYYAEAKKLAHEKNLDSYITLTGSISFEDVPQYLDAMDITILPGSNDYTSPMKLFEYMAMEKVVVAPRYRPIEEIIEHNIDGILFKPDDKDEFSQLVLDLCHDQMRRTMLGKTARSKIFKNYTWVMQAQKVLDRVEKFKM